MVNTRQSDIAGKLGISRVTVSKALRDHPDISRAMKKKIEETAREMGYIPNLIARQLNSRRTFTIGIVIPDLENSFFSYIVDTMIDYATGHNYHVLLTVSREKEEIERNNIENLIGMRVDGLLICLSQQTVGRQIFETAEKMKIPLVYFDRAFEKMQNSMVVFDDEHGALSTLDLIIREGYKEIGFLGGYRSTNIGQKRYDGFIKAMKKNRIKVNPRWIIEGGFELQDGYNSFKILQESGTMPEVLFTVNDRVAMGVYKAAREAGLKIPDDIGVFGYGFCEITDSLDPQLAVINQDPRRMGNEAMRLLIEEIDNNPVKGQVLVLEEKFLWRKSVKRKRKK